MAPPSPDSHPLVTSEVLYVGNVPQRATRARLEGIFEPCGKLLAADVLRDQGHPVKWRLRFQSVWNGEINHRNHVNMHQAKSMFSLHDSGDGSCYDARSDLSRRRPSVDSPSIAFCLSSKSGTQRIREDIASIRQELNGAFSGIAKCTSCFRVVS